MNDDIDTQKSAVHTAGTGPGFLPILVVAIVIIAAVGGIFAYNEFLKPEPALVTATIKIDFGNGTVLTEEIGSDNNTALGLLRTFVGEENIEVTEFGFINSINSIGNGCEVPGLNDTGQRWWMMYVNGTLGEVGADTLQIFDGDIVEFRFMIPEWL
jgi:hypothetical protein